MNFEELVQEISNTYIQYYRGGGTANKYFLILEQNGCIPILFLTPDEFEMYIDGFINNKLNYDPVFRSTVYDGFCISKLVVA